MNKLHKFNGEGAWKFIKPCINKIVKFLLMVIKEIIVAYIENQLYIILFYLFICLFNANEFYFTNLKYHTNE